MKNGVNSPLSEIQIAYSLHCSGFFNLTMVAATVVAPPVSSSGGANVNEVVKYVRHNINQSVLNYSAQKVKSRSTDVFNTYKGADHWKKTLDRREDQKSRGFFSRPDRRYKECGLVELQTKQLLVSSLENIGNKFPSQNEQSQHELDNKTATKDANTKQETYLTTGKRYTVRRSADNGVATIKQKLEKGDRRIVSIKAGQSLAAYLRREEEEKKREILESEQKNNVLDMNFIDPFEKHAATSNSMSSETNTNGLTESQQQKCRRTIRFQSKLDNLILLFTLTSNLKQRDLRTKTPLSMELLKILRKHGLPAELQPPPLPRPVENMPPSIGRYGRNSIMIPAGGSLLHNRDNQKQNGYRLFLPENHVESSSKHGELSSPLNNSSRKNRVNALRHKNSPSSTPNGIKVETWEDLVSIEAPYFARADSTTLEIDNTPRGVSRISIHGQTKLNVKKRAAPPWQTKTVTETLTPWMKVMQDQRDTKEKDIQNARQNGSLIKANKHDEIITSLKENFEATKNLYARKVQDELENRIDAYEKQFELMTCSSIRETDMKTMRERIQEWREHVNMSIARPPLWIEKLRSQQKNLRLTDEDTNKKFSQIMKFIETKSTLCLKAKICLLVFSLPIFELCVAEMMEAIKFFLEEILEQKDNSLNEWLHLRKLIKNNCL